MFGNRHRLAINYFGGPAGICLKSKQLDISSACLTRLFGGARLKMVSQNLIRLTCECCTLEIPKVVLLLGVQVDDVAVII